MKKASYLVSDGIPGVAAKGEIIKVSDDGILIGRWRPSSARGPDRRGVAMAVALFALLIISVLALGIWTIADINRVSSVNRQDATKAMGLAEAAVAHALSVLSNDLATIPATWLLLGSDSAASTADDGLLVDFGLAASDQIPASGYVMGGGRYFVTLLDDPAETDGDPLADENTFIIARCTGVTDDGGSATVDVRIGSAIPAIAVNGDLLLNGNPSVLGACGSVHANGNITTSGNATVQTGISASGTVVGSPPADTSGAAVVPTTGAREVDIPNLDPADYCGAADYILMANGMFVTLSPPSIVNANGVAQNGWILTSTSPVVWGTNGNAQPSGTYCVDGNVQFSANANMPLTILATGSVVFSGNPHITSAHPDGILIMSGGDVSVSGSPAGGDAYDGMIYAQSQCLVTGNMSMSIQLLCNDEPESAGAIDVVTTTEITGNVTITFDCTGGFSGPRRIMDWYYRLGS